MTAGMKPARYSTTSATPTLATSARFGRMTAGSAKSAARPSDESTTSTISMPMSGSGCGTPATNTARAAARMATVLVQITAAR
jgi:hypothetical protein